MVRSRSAKVLSKASVMMALEEIGFGELADAAEIKVLGMFFPI